MNKKIIILFVALCLDTNDDDSLSEQHDGDDATWYSQMNGWLTSTFDDKRGWIV